VTARRLRRRITKGDAAVVVAVRGALERLDRGRLDEFLKAQPGAQVQDVANAMLGGVVLEKSGPTGRGYDSVYDQLLAARRRLGLPPPRQKSIARYEWSPAGREHERASELQRSD
jgi:hypothetical protein